MDKAAIFSSLTRRNALRKANGLPLLDIRSEYAHDVSVARQRDYRSACDEHDDERQTIRQQVLAEYRERFGHQFSHTPAGQWMIGQLTYKRFVTLMAERYFLSPPDRIIKGHAQASRSGRGGQHWSQS